MHPISASHRLDHIAHGCAVPGHIGYDQHMEIALNSKHAPEHSAIACDTSGADDIDLEYMDLALAEARKAYMIGEVPVGAVVIDSASDHPRVIAMAHNLRETSRDASAHAEFIAMRNAMESLDAWRLEGCTVYVTLEPCIMCAGLMHQARIARCVFGAYDPKAGALGSLYSINEDTRLNHRFDARGGVRELQCSEILRDFFRERRIRAKDTEARIDA